MKKNSWFQKFPYILRVSLVLPLHLFAGSKAGSSIQRKMIRTILSVISVIMLTDFCFLFFLIFSIKRVSFDINVNHLLLH